MSQTNTKKFSWLSDDVKTYDFTSVSFINDALRLFNWEKGDKDKSLIIKILDEIHDHLRLLESPKGDQDQASNQYLEFETLGKINFWIRLTSYSKAQTLIALLKPYLEPTGSAILSFYVNPKSREQIFKKISFYNNTKNYNRHIKPLLTIGWLSQTIPHKPNSKLQQYITSETGLILLGTDNSAFKRIHISSSSIASAAYNQELQVLELVFHHGAKYHYFNVPETVFRELLNAPSHAKYFAANIKDVYAFEKV